MTDGTVTEIENEQLKEGTVVVIGDQTREAANPSTAASPLRRSCSGAAAGGIDWAVKG